MVISESGNTESGREGLKKGGGGTEGKIIGRYAFA